MTTMTAKQDMRTKMLRAAMTLAVMLMATVSAWAQTQTPTQYISEVMLIGKNKKSEAQALRDQYVAQGWTAIDQDLNAGCGSKSDYIYLLYKQRSTASPNHTFITQFYISDASGDAPDSRSFDGHTYKLVPYDGDDHFKEKKGDLNSNAGGKDIHLYYTTENSLSGTAVSNITFDATKSEAVGTFNGSAGYDLNKDAGGDDIYMHCESSDAPQWVITKNNDGVRCIVMGCFSRDLVYAFPAIINGLTVAGIDKSVNFSGFNKNLETIYFSQAYNANKIPSAYYCDKLKHVHVVDNSGTVVKADELPATVTSITDNTFACSTIESLKMPNVTGIGKEAFAGCRFLTSVTMPNVTSIGVYAFRSTALTSVTIPSGVTSIEYRVFFDCQALTSVSIPSSVTSIGNEAFYGCDALTSVTINGNPTIDVNAFPKNTELKLKLTPNKAADGTKWLTFYNDRYNFKHDVSTKVYKATVDGGKVCLNELDKTKVNVVLADGTTAESQASIVNAGTAVVLKTAMNRIEMYRTTDESDDTHPNDLQAVNARKYIPDMLAGAYKGYTIYVLTDKDGVGFYRYSADRMPQNKAFLALPPSAGAREFYPVAENGTSTSMEDVRWEKEDVRGKMEDVDGAWYSIDGRRLSGKPTQKGVYIYQGRKEVIR